MFDKRYWVQGVHAGIGGKGAEYAFISTPLLHYEKALKCVKTWVESENYTCYSATIKEEDISTGEKRIVFSEIFVDFIGNVQKTFDMEKYSICSSISNELNTLSNK